MFANRYIFGPELSRNFCVIHVCTVYCTYSKYCTLCMIVVVWLRKNKNSCGVIEMRQQLWICNNSAVKRNGEWQKWTYAQYLEETREEKTQFFYLFQFFGWLWLHYCDTCGILFAQRRKRLPGKKTPVQIVGKSVLRIRDGKKIRILDEHPGSYFRELRNNFWG
jgi:hypothetical protein